MDAAGLRRRFLLWSAVAWPAGALLLALMVRLEAGLAFAATYPLVAGDFLWLGHGVGKMIAAGPMTLGQGGAFAAGLVLRTLLLLGILYAILKVLPRGSLGVVFGIGGALTLLALAGAIPKRG
jgi:hypothetical protein